mgnify:CR=1 FL=1
MYLPGDAELGEFPEVFDLLRLKKSVNINKRQNEGRVRDYGVMFIEARDKRSNFHIHPVYTINILFKGDSIDILINRRAVKETRTMEKRLAGHREFTRGQVFPIKRTNSSIYWLLSFGNDLIELPPVVGLVSSVIYFIDRFTNLLLTQSLLRLILQPFRKI